MFEKIRLLFGCTVSAAFLSACATDGGHPSMNDTEAALANARKAEIMLAASPEDNEISSSASLNDSLPSAPEITAGWDEETTLNSIRKAEANGWDVSLTREEREELLTREEQLSAERMAAQEEQLAEERRLRMTRAREHCSEDTIDFAVSREVVVGMRESCARIAWGQPTSINRTVSEYGVREQWVYRGSRASANYLYFRDGVLNSISTSS